GIAFSNSYFFESIGWTGLLVEPHPALYRRCVDARPASRVVHAAVGAPGAQGSTRFSAVSGPGGVDCLSFSASAAEGHLDRVQREGGLVERVDVPLTTLD